MTEHVAPCAGGGAINNGPGITRAPREFYFGVRLIAGPACLEQYATREQLCETDGDPRGWSLWPCLLKATTVVASQTSLENIFPCFNDHRVYNHCDALETAGALL